jgi:hypothetical protein
LRRNETCCCVRPSAAASLGDADLASDLISALVSDLVSDLAAFLAVSLLRGFAADLPE